MSDTRAVSIPFRRVAIWIGLGLLVTLGPVLVLRGPDGLSADWSRWLALFRDEARLEAWIQELGWIGPLALIGLNALQIVVAPIPAYGLYAAAGFLYGGLWGGLYCAIGTLIGVTLAMTLARTLGRPLVERLVEPERLARWDRLLGEQRLWIWALLLLAPIGDLPYFLAGLARVSIPKMLLLTAIIRVPTVFVIAAAADQVSRLQTWQLGLILAVLVVLLALVVRYQSRWMAWFETHILHHTLDPEPPSVETEP